MAIQSPIRLRTQIQMKYLNPHEENGTCFRCMEWMKARICDGAVRGVHPGEVPVKAGNPTDDIVVPFTLADGVPFENIQLIQIDRNSKKWLLRSPVAPEPQRRSLDDNGTPTDKSDDTWTSYSTF